MAFPKALAYSLDLRQRIVRAREKGEGVGEVAQRELLRKWTDIFRYIPALMAIGIGIAFNNAVAAIEGFFCKAGEFVRTPKFGDQAHRGGAWQRRLSGFRFRGAWKAWADWVAWAAKINLPSTTTLRANGTVAFS